MIRVILAFLGFISLGMPDMLLGVAWPSMRADFDAPLSLAGVLVLAGTLGYTGSALSAVWIMQHMRLGQLLALSALVTSLGLLVYLLTPSAGFLILLVFAAGFGGGAIDVAFNQYVIDYHSARLMQWLHASFGAGVTVGPVLVALALTSEGGWRLAYSVVGGCLLALATLFLLTARVWPSLSIEDESKPTSRWQDSLTKRPVQIQIAMFVIYTGCELAVGLWAFALMTEGRDIDIVQAGFWVSVYWGAFTLTRIAMGWVAETISHRQLLRFSLIMSALGAVLWWANPTPLVGLLALALLGIGFGPIYPGLMSATRDRVGEVDYARTVSLQVGLAVVGAGVVASSIGWLVDLFGVNSIPVALCALVAGMVLLERAQVRG